MKKRGKFNELPYIERVRHFAGGRATVGTVTQVLDKGLKTSYVGKVRSTIVERADGQRLYETEAEAKQCAVQFLEHCKAELARLEAGGADDWKDVTIPVLGVVVLPKEGGEKESGEVKESPAVRDQGETAVAANPHSPENTYMLDFIGIGFHAGVDMALEEIGKVLPEVQDLSLDVEGLRARWAEREGDAGQVLHFNRFNDGRFVVSHSWAYRWLAAMFLDHMQQIGAERWIRQEIEISPALTSGVPGIMIEVSRIDWWREQKRKGKK